MTDKKRCACGTWAGTDGRCGRCRALNEERKAREQAEREARTLTLQLERQQVEAERIIASQRRYRVVITRQQWDNLTWNEAVERAEMTFDHNPSLGHISIENEANNVVRKYERKEGRVRVVA